MFERLRITLEEWGLDANLLLDIIIPVAILLFGWLAAIFIGGMVRRALNRTQLDDKIARLIVGDGADSIDSARWTGKAVYYLVMLFVLMAFLARLGLTVATEPINHFLSTFTTFFHSATSTKKETGCCGEKESANHDVGLQDA